MQPDQKNSLDWTQHNYCESFQLNLEAVMDNVKGQTLYSCQWKNLWSNMKHHTSPWSLPNGLSQEGQSAQKWTLECLRRKYRNQKFKRRRTRMGTDEDEDGGCYIEYTESHSQMTAPFTSLTAATGNTPKEGNF